MKVRIQLTILLLFISIVSYGQALRTIKTYYYGGQLSEFYTVINDTGLKHGTYKSYNINGNLDLVVNYNKNMRHGKCVQYDSDRGTNIKVEGEYFNDKQHGTWTYYVHASNNIEEIQKYDKGEYLSRTTYYPNGKKKNTENYYGLKTKWIDNKQNKPVENCCGLFTEWHDNGQKAVEGYKVRESPNGSYWMCKWDGVVKEWYRDGSIESSISYTNGIATDSAKYYYPTGTLKTIKRNDKEGNFMHIDYYPSGLKYQEIKSTPQKSYITILYDSIDQRKIVEFEQTNEQYTSQSNKFISEKTYTEDGILDRMTDKDDHIYKYRPDGSVEWKLFPNEKWYTDYHDRDNLGSRSKDYFCRKYEDYDKDGQLIKSGTVDDEERLDIEYVIYENDKIIERGSRDKNTGGKSYTMYDENGKISKIATVDKIGYEITYTLFENGQKIKEQLGNKDIYCYDNGKVIAYLCNSESMAYLLNENGIVEQIEYSPTGANIYFYPNGIIKSKGYLKDGIEVGVWYYYSPKGKLTSVKQDGVEREPTKEEKANHETFLIELIQKRK